MTKRTHTCIYLIRLNDCGNKFFFPLMYGSVQWICRILCVFLKFSALLKSNKWNWKKKIFTVLVIFICFYGVGQLHRRTSFWNAFGMDLAAQRLYKINERLQFAMCSSYKSIYLLCYDIRNVNVSRKFHSWRCYMDRRCWKITRAIND